MTAASAPSPTSSAVVLERIETVARELFDVQMADLSRIADIAMEMIESLGRMQHEAEAGPDVPGRNAAPPKVETVILAFCRVTRALRLTRAMQNDLVGKARAAESAGDFAARLAEDLARRSAAAAYDPPPVQPRPPATPAAPLTPEAAAVRSRKDQIAHILTGLVRDAAESDGEREARLMREASECLNEGEDFADILSRPVSDVIAHVCGELGIDPDWPRLSTHLWAQDEMKSGQVGAALAALSPSPWMGEGSGMGVEACPIGAASEGTHGEVGQLQTDPPPLTPAKAGAQADSQPQPSLLQPPGITANSVWAPAFAGVSGVHGGKPPTPADLATASPPHPSAPAPTGPPAG